MEWLATHWRALTGGGGLLTLLVVFRQRGNIGQIFRAFQTIHQTERAFTDAVEKQRDLVQAQCEDCLAELNEVKRLLQDRIRTDDARDEIHQQDLTDKRQMGACIEKLKSRLRENHIPFDDLV